MSNGPTLRRSDREMASAEVESFLREAYCGRLATSDTAGLPYVCPMLFVWRNGEIWFHNTSHTGHLLTNVRQQPHVCFEIDEPGEAFAYGRFQCDTGLAYRSVMAFGKVRITEDSAEKALFFDGLMAKYYGDDPDRPKGFYPRLNDVTVYAVQPERLTGKTTRLPVRESLWPLVDRTMSPKAVPP